MSLIIPLVYKYDPSNFFFNENVLLKKKDYKFTTGLKSKPIAFLQITSIKESKLHTIQTTKSFYVDARE